jgi:mannose-6-phosphate isomerase-like protein (cupin superfamily)
MSRPIVVVDAAAREWETWPQDQLEERGGVEWKTLIDAGVTPSDTLTLGIGLLRPDEPLRLHRHAHPEVYLLLEGTAVVSVDGAEQEVAAGAAVFIPGGARHSIAAAGGGEARFAYVFAADSMDEVEYDFGA